VTFNIFSRKFFTFGNFWKKNPKKSPLDNPREAYAFNLLLEKKNSPHNLLSNLCDLGYFGGGGGKSPQPPF